MKASVHDAVAGIDPAAWNALAGDYPFLRHEFLLAAEESGAASPDSGWTPRHITLEQDGAVVAAMPLYEKSHSWGEFVFDWAWAQAYERAGLRYYPKLVSAVPFTPAPSRRLLGASVDDTQASGALIDAATALATRSDCSSLHILFAEPAELPQLQASGLKLRKDCQFHWHNRGYADFDKFLATFSSRKRKKVRADRRKVADAGIAFRHLGGETIDEATWRRVHELISITFLRRGSLPYFDLDFFLRITASMPGGIRVILAELGSTIVATAVFFESGNTLYGRYWGCDGDYDALHFETCYYQGIEYCIESGKALFEPGTQGEHKISRGFVPVATWSAHWLNHPEFFSAIGNYLNQESRYVDSYIDAVDERSPYRNSPGRDTQ
jgi:predicted N-acyltransferase